MERVHILHILSVWQHAVEAEHGFVQETRRVRVSRHPDAAELNACGYRNWSLTQSLYNIWPALYNPCSLTHVHFTTHNHLAPTTDQESLISLKMVLQWQASTTRL